MSRGALSPAASNSSRRETALSPFPPPLPTPILAGSFSRSVSMQQSSALGYLVLLLRLLSQVMSVPLLLRSSFQGSTTRVWSPGGWWEFESRAPYDALPVQYSRAETGFVAGVLAAAGASDDSGAEIGAQDSAERVSEAMLLLSRAAGMLCHAACAGVVPARFGSTPFAWVASLCDEVAGAKADAARRPRGTAAGWSGAVRPRRPDPDATADVALAASSWGGVATDDPDFDGADGWEIMPRPSYGRLIPPPPSATEDVEHWTRAMYGAPPAASGSADTPTATARYVRTARSAQTWLATRLGWQR